MKNGLGIGKTMYYDQSEYDVKCEWGINGVEALAGVSDVFIIVDVLSFSTCVDVAVSSGAVIYPYKYRDESTLQLAKELGAELAVSRKDNPEGKKYSLLLTSLLSIPNGTKLILPSPNGSSISFAANKKPLICGCIRNAKAVAEYANKKYKCVSVIPAGEKWENDNTLRPALEDMIGAGAIISHLKGSLSPESKSMLSVYNAFKHDLKAGLNGSSSGKEHKSVFDTFKLISSGRELIERGYERDIEIASELNVSDCVPILVKGAYVNAEMHVLD